VGPHRRQSPSSRADRNGCAAGRRDRGGYATSDHRCVVDGGDREGEGFSDRRGARLAVEADDRHFRIQQDRGLVAGRFGRYRHRTEPALKAQLRADDAPAKEDTDITLPIKGWVISGAFAVTQSGDLVTCGPGEIFEVDEGELHDESIGPNGPIVLVGRKFANAQSSDV
jgi:hypothetical protein